MILVDTSAWVEYLRDTGSPVAGAVDVLLAAEIATCGPIVMEVLAGARDDLHLLQLRRLLARAVLLPVSSSDYEDAAAIYRHCRRAGSTVRRLLDCLIASVAIRDGVPLLHADADFHAISRCTPLVEYERGG